METQLNNIDKLTKMYNKQSYYDVYGGSTVFSVLFVIGFFSLVSYITLSNKFAYIRKNWGNYRCNPQVIPLAGIINKDPHKGVLETTADNFTNCTSTILTEITGEFLTPIYSVTSSLENMVKNAVHDVQMIRTKIGSIVSNVEDVDRQIMGRIMNFLMPIKLMFIKIRDMLGKTNATLMTGMYTAIGTYLGLKSFIAAFAVLLLIPLAFCLLTAGILEAGLFTAPLAVPFWFAAGVLIAFLVWVALLEHEILEKQKV